MTQQTNDHPEVITLQRQKRTGRSEQWKDEPPTYHTPQVVVIDKAIHRMKNDVSGSAADAGGLYTYTHLH